VLLRRLSLSRANKPRKRYEGYDADAKKDNGGLDHWSVGSWARSGGRPECPSTIGVAWVGAQGFVGLRLSVLLTWRGVRNPTSTHRNTSVTDAPSNAGTSAISPFQMRPIAGATRCTVSAVYCDR